MLQALLRHRADVRVVCCIDYRGVGLAALAARAITHAPVVFQAQTEGVISGARVRDWLAHVGVSRDGAVAGAMTWPARALYGRADAIGCISRGIERETLDAGVLRERVHYLPNPIDTRLFSPPAPDVRRQIRTQFGLPAGVIVAVFVGRLSREKGRDRTRPGLGAGKARRPARPDRTAMTGSPVGCQRRRTPSRRAARARGFGAVRRARSRRAPSRHGSKRADFAIQPSHFEAMGLAAAEAMAAGLPVIASDTGGYRDFVTHEENGLLVAPKDVPALAGAITRLATDAALRAALGRRARATAERFDEMIVLEQFAQVIDALARHD